MGRVLNENHKENLDAFIHNVDVGKLAGWLQPDQST
jgi:hypothetical protein